MQQLRFLALMSMTSAVAAQAYRRRPVWMIVLPASQPVIMKLCATAKLAACEAQAQGAIGAAGTPARDPDAPDFARYRQASAAKPAGAVARIGKVE